MRLLLCAALVVASVGCKTAQNASATKSDFLSDNGLLIGTTYVQNDTPMSYPSTSSFMFSNSSDVEWISSEGSMSGSTKLTGTYARHGNEIDVTVNGGALKTTLVLEGDSLITKSISHRDTTDPSKFTTTKEGPTFSPERLAGNRFVAVEQRFDIEQKTTVEFKAGGQVTLGSWSDIGTDNQLVKFPMSGTYKVMGNEIYIEASNGNSRAQMKFAASTWSEISELSYEISHNGSAWEKVDGMRKYVMGGN